MTIGCRAQYCLLLIAALFFHTAGAQVNDGASTVANPAPNTEAAAVSPFSSNVTLASQYVSRGFRQTWGRPALQGGFDYNNPNGLFAGTWLSSVSGDFIDHASTEWDLYTGYNTTAGDFSYGGSVYYYVYAGAKTSAATGSTSYDYGELVPTLSYRWFTVKYWLTYTKDYFGFNSDTLGVYQDQHSRWSGYLDVNANVDLPCGVTGLLHYGRQRVASFAMADFSDMRIGLSKKLDNGWLPAIAYTRGWDRDAYYRHFTNTEANAAQSNPIASTVIVSMTRVF